MPDLEHIWWSDIYISEQAGVIAAHHNLLRAGHKQLLLLHNQLDAALFIDRGQLGAFVLASKVAEEEHLFFRDSTKVS